MFTHSLSRFPGGESYRDLIKRLESVIIDMEQQTGPVLVVSHVSVLQSLIAYFRQSPISQCMSIEVPLHTVIKFTPSRGGGWMESRHPLLPEESDEKMVPVMSESELSALSCSEHVAASPIWGDHVAPKRANSNS
jgi:broad specificity phosphatase PhoE